MVDTGEHSNRFVCPNDRQLALRAKLKTGWSIKTGSMGYHNTNTKNNPNTGLDSNEQAAILDVIHRAEQIELREQERVGKLVDRLDNMRRNALGKGPQQCLLCGDRFGLLGAQSVPCAACGKPVCQKCAIEAWLGDKRSQQSSQQPPHGKEQWLCKICAETREIWKKSGAWFFKGLPKYVLPGQQKDCRKYPGKYSPPQKSPKIEDDSSEEEVRGLLGVERRSSVSESNTSPNNDISPGQYSRQTSSSTSSSQRSVSTASIPHPAVSSQTLQAEIHSPYHGYSGINQLGMNPQGTNSQGTNQQGTNYQGTNPQGINQPGINQLGMNPQGTNPTWTEENVAFVGNNGYQGTQGGYVTPQPPQNYPSYGSYSSAHHYSISESSRRDSIVSRISTAGSVAGSTVGSIGGSGEYVSWGEDLSSGVGSVASLVNVGYSKATSPSNSSTPPSPSISLTLSYDAITSTLHLSLHRAKNLPAMDINGLADPFCKLSLIPEGKPAARLRTKTVHKTKNPEFDEALTFYEVSENDLLRKSLLVVVLDDDRFGKDYLGEAKISLAGLRVQKCVNITVPLDKTLPDDCTLGPDTPLPSWFEDPWSRGQILISLSYSTKKRALLVLIVRCANLLPMDNNGFSDPFVKMYLKPDPHHRKYKTSIKWKNLNPYFNEEFPFETRPNELSTQSLYITVWDKDYGKSNDYLGGLVLGGVGSKGRRLKHWLDVIRYPDHRHEYWHSLTEDTLTD